MVKSDLLDNGSERYSDVMLCPYCDEDSQNFKIGRNVCNLCEGKFKIEYDDAQDIYIIIKEVT